MNDQYVTIKKSALQIIQDLLEDLPSSDTARELLAPLEDAILDRPQGPHAIHLPQEVLVDIAHASAILSTELEGPSWEKCYFEATQKRQSGFVEVLQVVGEVALAYELEYQKRFNEGENPDWLEGLTELAKAFPAIYIDKEDPQKTIIEIFENQGA